MSELEDMINSVLSDPAQMEMINGLAKSLMGGGEVPAADTQPGVSAPAFPGLDSSMLSRIGALMGSDRSPGNDKKALLEAMKPYLSEKRRQKMDKALKIARLARIAGIAMGETEGSGNV